VTQTPISRSRSPIRYTQRGLNT